MERKISFGLYAGAFLLSLAVFIIGVYIGALIDQSNLQRVSDDVTAMTEKIASIQVLMLSGENSSNFCSVYTSELASLDQEVEKAGYMLSYLEDEKGIFDDSLKKKYFILEGQSYLLSQKAVDDCGMTSTLLINFYTNKGCARCKEQGIEVLKARDAAVAQGVNVKLFSFDGEIGSTVADAFAAQFNVTAYPTIVINGVSYPGFRTSGQLKGILVSG